MTDARRKALRVQQAYDDLRYHADEAIRALRAMAADADEVPGASRTADALRSAADAVADIAAERDPAPVALRAIEEAGDDPASDHPGDDDPREHHEECSCCVCTTRHATGECGDDCDYREEVAA